MRQIVEGCLCKSIKGHDKNTVYVLIRIGKEVLLCDGKFKKLCNPKKKNFKHIEVIDYIDEVLEKKIAVNNVHDEDIKYSIKNYLIHSKCE